MKLISIVTFPLLFAAQTASAAPDLGLATRTVDETTDDSASMATQELLEGVEGTSSLRGLRGTDGGLFNGENEPHDDEPRYPKLIQPPANVTVVEDEYIVILEESVADVGATMNTLLEVVNKLRRGFEAEGFGELWNINDSFKGQAVRMTHEQAETMSEMDDVRYIESNIRLVDHSKSRQAGGSSVGKNLVASQLNTDTDTHTAVQGYPETSTPYWNLDRIDQRKITAKGLDKKYNPSKTGEGVLAIILGDGINGNHADFEGRVKDNGQDPFQTNPPCEANEDVGVGTFLAAIVGGKDHGVAKKVDLLNVRLERCGGRGTKLSHYLDTIENIAKMARETVPRIVVNGSISFDVADVRNTLQEAIKDMIEDGVVFVVEAGDGSDRSNFRNPCSYFPARLKETITVGATEWDKVNKNEPDVLSPKTNLGCVDIFAPGDRIVSADKNSTTASEMGRSGTSFAAPHVTGAVALILQENNKLTPEQVKQELIKRSTKDVIRNLPPTSPNRLLFVNDEAQ